jgi:hypothetical protein
MTDGDRQAMLEKQAGKFVEGFNRLWSGGGVKLAVDTSAPGVILPWHIVARFPEATILPAAPGDQAEGRKAIVLVLHYPLHPVIPIPDLKIDTKGISATLSFDRQPHATFVPWAAVLGMASLYDEPDPEDPPVPRRHLRSVP